MHKHSRVVTLVFSLVLLATPLISLGASTDTTTTQPFFRAKVTTIVRTGESVDETGARQSFQLIRAKLLDGEKKGQEVEVEYGGNFVLESEQMLVPGDTVVLGLNEGAEKASYYIRDHYRLPSLWFFLALFVVLTVVLGGWRGLGSLGGLIISGVVIIGFVVPRIVAGNDPTFVSLIGAAIIVCSSLYLAHGFNKRASVALVGTLLTLGIAAGLAVAAVSFSSLFGLGSEDALTLQLTSIDKVINFRGLLLGGILLGTLGVLDDITAGQSAVVDELHRANPNLSSYELYRRGLSVGREHIAALVNTLVLAYAGISMPLFLLLSYYHNEPTWVTLNGENIAEEIVRTLVGSSAIMLAVPITTLLAAYVFGRSHKNASNSAPLQ